MVLAFNLRWPRFVVAFAGLLRVSWFDVQFLRPHCLLPQRAPTEAFVAVFALKTALPLVFVLVFAGMLALARVYALVRRHVPVHRWPACERRLRAITPTDLGVLRQALVGGYLAVLQLVHIAVTLAALGVLACEAHAADGTWRLQAEPAVPCYTAAWRRMVAAACAALVLFTCGLPLLCTWLLRRRRHRLHERETQLRYGLLYRRYERRVYWFEAAVIVRKVLMGVVRAFLAQRPAVQAVCALAVLGAALAVHEGAWPYRSRSANQLERALLVACVLVVSLGLGVLSVADAAPAVATALSVRRGTAVGGGGGDALPRAHAARGLQDRPAGLH